ncbi:MAG: hypothetical protein AAF458_11095 [Pseudomonadota bacterium]
MHLYRSIGTIDTIPSHVHLAPTATKLPEDPTGKVIVCGSHGGAYAGYLVARTTAGSVILNDAGVGRDRAGIGTLTLCEAIDMPAATVGHESARIGDAMDMYVRGVISHVNEPARALGCTPGMSCGEAAARLEAAGPHRSPRAYAEARTLLGQTSQGLRIVCVDSISLVDESDVGQVVLSGSHGAVVSGQRALAIRVKAAAAFFNDAGVGADGAGISRLPVLDEMGVAGVTVTTMSARIGDARSTYEDGVVSAVNACAAAFGLATGMRAVEAADRVVPTR